MDNTTIIIDPTRTFHNYSNTLSKHCLKCGEIHVRPYHNYNGICLKCGIVHNGRVLKPKEPEPFPNPARIRHTHNGFCWKCGVNHESNKHFIGNRSKRTETIREYMRMKSIIS